VYENQHTQAKKDGFALESLAAKACAKIHDKFPDFISVWLGQESYLGAESIATTDFVVGYKKTAFYLEMKNTNGKYYASQYPNLRSPKSEFTIFAKMKSDDATCNYFRSFGLDSAQLGKKIVDWPFKDNGQIKRKYRQPYNKLICIISQRAGIEPDTTSGILKSSAPSNDVECKESNLVSNEELEDDLILGKLELSGAKSPRIMEVKHKLRSFLQEHWARFSRKLRGSAFRHQNYEVDCSW